MTDKLMPPEQEDFEREQRDLFRNPDITKVSAISRIPYGTLTKQLNPNDVTESITYQFLHFLYSCSQWREELGEQVWALVTRHRARAAAGISWKNVVRFPSIVFRVTERETNSTEAELEAIGADVRIADLNAAIDELSAFRDWVAAQHSHRYEDAAAFRGDYGGEGGSTRADLGRSTRQRPAQAVSNGEN
jgi:hypothetical protein